jgi:hypothetical protein
MFKREGSEQETISNRDYKEASIILVGSIVILLGLGVWGVLQE